MRRVLTLLLAVGAVCGLPARAASLPHYHVARHIPLPGNESWDYLFADSTDHRLYIAHGSVVQVLDLVHETLAGTVPAIEGAHGVAVSHGDGHGFATSGRDSSVVMFDLATLGVLKRIPVQYGTRCDAIVFEPSSRRVFVMNGGSRNAVSIATATGEVKEPIALEGKPEFAVADGRGAVFVNNEDSSWVAGFDAKDTTPRVRWRLAPGEGPSGLAYDAEDRLLFSVCENKCCVVMDATNGHVLQTLPIGAGCDGVAYDPVTHLVFASCGEGTMTVLRRDAGRHFIVHEVVPTARGARTVAVDPATHRVYTCTAKYEPTPEPVKGRPRGRAAITPGTFEVLVLEP